MYRLIESIKLEDGQFFNLPFHQLRMDRSVRALSKQANLIRLEKHLASIPFPHRGLFKCRVLYEQEIQQVECIPYSQTPVRSLKVVHANDIRYDHKFEDRSALNSLLALRNSCDDILIVKNGFVTDSSYSNLIFSDERDWITPHRPLLEGTMRHYLLEEGILREAPIRIEHIHAFRSCKLINAMLGMDGPELSISQIVF